jgi:hypothetical protein
VVKYLLIGVSGHALKDSIRRAQFSQVATKFNFAFVFSVIMRFVVGRFVDNFTNLCEGYF